MKNIKPISRVSCLYCKHGQLKTSRVLCRNEKSKNYWKELHKGCVCSRFERELKYGV